VLQQFKGYAYPRAAEQASGEMLGGDLGTLLYDTAKFLKDNQEVDVVDDLEVYQRALYKDAADAAAAEGE
jgi:taurine transport system substrate-binding protein